MPSRLTPSDYEAEFGALEVEREAMAEFVGLASDQALQEKVERHRESGLTVVLARSPGH
jgi:hypothetical protein